MAKRPTKRAKVSPGKRLIKSLTTLRDRLRDGRGLKGMRTSLARKGARR